MRGRLSWASHGAAPDLKSWRHPSRAAWWSPLPLPSLEGCLWVDESVVSLSCVQELTGEPR